MSSDACELRKYEDNLNVCGIGVVILSAWDIFKVSMQLLLKTKDFAGDFIKQFEELEKVYVIGVFIFFIAIAILALALIFLLHAYIGINASRAAKRLTYKKGYYVWAIILLGLSVFSMFDYVDRIRNLEEIETTVAFLALGLAISGIKDIIFYFRMARHMVGGKMILIQGAIIFDFAILTGSLANVPKIYILLYLIGIHAFSGIVEILRAMEAKNTVEGPWKIKFGHGLINIALAIACLIFIRNSNTAIMIYSIGLIYSAIVRIFNSFQRTSFILIQ